MAASAITASPFTDRGYRSRSATRMIDSGAMRTLLTPGSAGLSAGRPRGLRARRPGQHHNRHQLRATVDDAAGRAGTNQPLELSADGHFYLPLLKIDEKIDETKAIDLTPSDDMDKQHVRALATSIHPRTNGLSAGGARQPVRWPARVQWPQVQFLRGMMRSRGQRT